MKATLAYQARIRRETPFPIILKINQESWAETFKYRVIERQFREEENNILCFVPSYHQLYVDWCCFVNPDGLTTWMENLKKRHPIQMEKVTDFGIARVWWYCCFGLGPRINKLGTVAMKIAKEGGHEGYSGIHDLLSLLLQFPRLETLRVDFLEMYRSSRTEINSGRMGEAIREFLNLQTFKRRPPKLLRLASVQQGL